MDRLQGQLETLFTGLSDTKPKQTGMLSALPTIGTDQPEPASGWAWQTDTEGRYTWCSREVSHFLDFEAAELLGERLYEVGFDFQSTHELRRLVSIQQPLQNLRVLARNSRGQTLHLLLHAELRRSASGEIAGYRGVSQVLKVEEEQQEKYTAKLPHEPERISATTPAPVVATWGTVSGYSDDGTKVRPLDGPMGAIASESQIGDGRLVVPIRVQDSILGVLEFDQETDGQPWEEDDRLLVEEVAQQLALALQDARSYQLTQQALEEMREADRLKAQFLANMSHELRTPLNSIIGFSRVILKGIDGPVTETQSEDLNAIYSAGQHLLGLINDILDLSKIEAGKMELAFGDVDLAEIIRGVMSTAVGLVKDKDIELIVNVPDDLPIVQADNIRLRQVLLNLISNAAKFTDEGHIATSARVLDRGDSAEILVSVSDTGHGIKAEDQPKLFEPFSQVDPSPTRKTEGTGLGLSITRHLVELHGGRIWVESTPGAGSTFRFTLPLDLDAPEGSTHAPAPQSW